MHVVEWIERETRDVWKGGYGGQGDLQRNVWWRLDNESLF